MKNDGDKENYNDATMMQINIKDTQAVHQLFKTLTV